MSTSQREDDQVKRKIIAAATAVAIATLGATACGSSGKGSSSSAPKSITVWLQTDAQTLWPQAVTDATALFHKKYPTVKVTVDYQAWTDHLTKFDATEQAHTAPDVIEFGNSETAQYIANDALKDLSSVKGTFDNSATWLDGLTQSCQTGGKLYCVPYYGGDRAVTYRKDMFTAAGIKAPPTSWDELLADVKTIAAKHKGDPNFSAFYMPGAYPYGGLPFVIDAGGQIATQSGSTWTAQLESPQAQQGLANWKALIDAGYKGDRTATDLNTYTQMVNGKTAMFYDSSGQATAVFGAKGNPAMKDKIGTFPMPSPTNTGQFLPPFMGGSDLAVPNSSKNPDVAEAWIRAYTSTSIEKEFVSGGFLANTKSLTSSDPILSAFSQELAHTWFVPLAPNWAQVEKDNVTNTMLVGIATGKMTIAQATKAADQAIDKDLNASS
jgi:N,N'-diacetylchitobiose transport system substrate-binding protein